MPHLSERNLSLGLSTAGENSDSVSIRVETALAGKRVAVLVIGDLGRSPRISYQALALAEAGASVDLIGLAGTTCLREIEEHSKIRMHRIQPRGRLRWPPNYLRLALDFKRRLEQLRSIDLILVQSPPAMPTLSIAASVALERRAALVIDWHNHGAAMLALGSPFLRPFTPLFARREHSLAQRAHGHLAVTAAFADFLGTVVGIAEAPVRVLYDRPVSVGNKPDQRFRTDLLQQYFGDLSSPEDLTRTTLIVSPTSWSRDEDFDLLLNALEVYRRESVSVPGSVAVLLSGDGPLRNHFEREVKTRFSKTQRLQIATAWLSAEDYLRLLRCADLGICLHRSASGLDLPMKLADMRGAGLPSLTLRYGDVLEERFVDGTDGWYFSTADDLARLLVDLTGAGRRQLEQTGRRLQAKTPRSFVEGWTSEALPLFEQLLARSTQLSAR